MYPCPLPPPRHHFPSSFTLSLGIWLEIHSAAQYYHQEPRLIIVLLHRGRLGARPVLVASCSPDGCCRSRLHGCVQSGHKGWEREVAACGDRFYQETKSRLPRILWPELVSHGHLWLSRRVAACFSRLWDWGAQEKGVALGTGVASGRGCCLLHR